MIHVHHDELRTKMTASPGILIRRSWAQFTAGLPEDALITHGMNKLDMLGCPSSEWTEEEKLGSLVSIQSEGERAIAYMESTVVDISIPPPSFKLVSLSCISYILKPSN